MHRLLPNSDARLVALLDESDHLMIQISLACDVALQDEARLGQLRGVLSNVESQIRARK